MTVGQELMATWPHFIGFRNFMARIIETIRVMVHGLPVIPTNQVGEGGLQATSVICLDADESVA